MQFPLTISLFSLPPLPSSHYSPPSRWPQDAADSRGLRRPRILPPNGTRERAAETVPFREGMRYIHTRVLALFFRVGVIQPSPHTQQFSLLSEPCAHQRTMARPAENTAKKKKNKTKRRVKVRPRDGVWARQPCSRRYCCRSGYPVLGRSRY